MRVSEVERVNGLFGTGRTPADQVRDAGFGPATQPVQVGCFFKLVVSHHRIPKVVGSKIAVDSSTHRPGRVNVARTDHEGPRADVLQGLARAVKVAFAGWRWPDEG